MSEAGRRWLELSARRPVAEDASALLVEALLSLGGRAAEERDGWVVTHLPGPVDPIALAERARELVQSVTGAAAEVTVRWCEDEEWSETWKRGIGLRRVTERILVRPSWLPAPEGSSPEATIVLDPGMAFGTAEHGTTRGCLRLLDSVVGVGDHMLDVGAGSGILAIAGVLLGAASCVAVEADPLSCEALRENLARNGVAPRVRCIEGRMDTEGLVALGPVSGVAANIETGVLRALLPGFAGVLASGGWLVLSGILESEWPSFRHEVERSGFRYVRLDEDGEWRSGLFERRERGLP